jgi:hypothetical protein
MTPECRDCRFWAAIGVSFGECRRHAPAPAQIRDDDTTSPTRLRALWPVTQEIDFCGEFSARSPDADT